MAKDIPNHFKTHENEKYFPKDLLEDLQSLFQEILKSEKKQNWMKFELNKISFVRGKLEIPTQMGVEISNLFQKSDFSGLFWIIVQLISQQIEKILSYKMDQYDQIFEQNFRLLRDICNLLKVCRIASEKNNNSFCFNYGYMLAFMYFFMINLVEHRLQMLIVIIVSPIRETNQKPLHRF